MPRIAGVRERRDHILFETVELLPGEQKRLFEKTGTWRLDQTYLCIAVGLRCVGQSREQEMLALDHLSVEFSIGDKPYGQIPGAVCSLQLNDDAIEKLATRMAEFAEQKTEAERETQYPGSRIYGRLGLLPGYMLLRPLVVPVRQSFFATVSAGEGLSGETRSNDLVNGRPFAPVKVQTLVFGLLTRDIA